MVEGWLLKEGRKVVVGGVAYKSSIATRKLNVYVIQVVKMIEAGDRLKGPKNCPPKVYAIMLECWSMEADGRPSFVQLLTKFTDLLTKK
jgi:hypothetical protein